MEAETKLWKWPHFADIFKCIFWDEMFLISISMVFHWSLFLRFQVTISWCWFRFVMAWRHAHMCHLASNELTHWGRDKMPAISQTTLSNSFSWMKMLEFRLKFHWNLFLRVQLTIFQHWFRWWLGADQATSHYLNQWWLGCRCIYASLCLNELIDILDEWCQFLLELLLVTETL